MNTKSTLCIQNALAALLLAGAVSASAATYNVGPGQPIAALNDVPWAALAPGDLVQIHPKPGGYHESFLISASGTVAQPITIRGVPDPVTGALPVIDGQDAVQDPDLHVWATVLHNLGVVIISRRADQPYGYIPSNLLIEKLDIRQAKKDFKFTNYAGVTANWPKFCAAIYTEMAQNLTVRNCELRDSGIGFFANSKYGTAALSSNLVIEACWIHNNGNVGSFSEHNVYTETAAITFQGNLIGPVAPGSNGENIKDRSAVTIIRYNKFLMGGGAPGVCVWLEQPQGGLGVIDQMPAYTNSFFYGNVIYNAPGGGGNQMVRYDAGAEDIAHAHKGTLYFYNNTIINHADKFGAGGRYKASVLQLPAASEFGGGVVPEVIDCRNNIIVNVPATPGAATTEMSLLYSDAGTLNLGPNWVSAGVMQYTLPYGLASFVGQINGWGNLTFGNDPGFVDFASLDLRPANGSPCIDGSGPIAPGLVGAHDVTREFLAPHTSEPRPIFGAAMDLGAFESNAAPPPGALRFGAASLGVSEGEPSAAVTVLRIGGSGGAVSVQYATGNGSATAGADYTAQSGSLAWADGDMSSRVVVIPILNDNVQEGAENLTVTLSAPGGGATLGSPSVATIVIADDETRPPGSPMIVFQTDRDGNQEIYAMNPDGTAAQNLTFHPANDVTPSVSRDGDRIVFASDRGGNYDIYLMNRNGSGVVNVSNDPGLDYDPEISPDGTKVLFQSTRTGNYEIWVVDATGGNQQNLTQNASHDVFGSWRPDGQAIVFASYRDNNGGEEIYTMNANGTGQTRLTFSSGRDFYPVFSPDGGRIAFTSERDGNREIYVMDANGSNPVNLTQNAALDQLPWFSPDGSQIVFSSNRDGNFELYAMSANGGPATRLTQIGSQETYPSWSGSEPPAITSASPLPTGILGVAYSHALNATGGMPPYDWSVADGALPAGLSLGANGTISGTPTAGGAFEFTAMATDVAGASATMAFAMTVLWPPDVTGFAPAYGAPDAVVTITGTHFIGATEVQFNGVSADFLVDSDSQISALVPEAATAGPIRVTGPGGTDLSSGSFYVIPSLAYHTLYVADTGNHRIQKSSDGVTWTVIAGGFGTGLGQFKNPEAVGVSADGQTIYVADKGNNRIQESVNGGQTWTLFAGSNIVQGPQGVAVSLNGDVYVSDTVNSRVLRFAGGNPSAISTLASWGSSSGATTQVRDPMGLAITAEHTLFIADKTNNRILRINNAHTSKASVVVAGKGSGTTLGQVKAPQGVAVDNDGNLYVADTGNNRVLFFPLGNTGSATVLASSPDVKAPEGVTVSRFKAGPLAGDNSLVVGDTGNYRVLGKHDLDTPGLFTLLGGPGVGTGQFVAPGKVR